MLPPTSQQQAEERLQYWKEIQRLTAAEEDLKT